MSHTCQYCFKRKKQCHKPVPLWTKLVLGISKGAVSFHFHLCILMAFALPFAVEEHVSFHKLPQCLDIINFWQQRMLCMLDHLCESSGIDKTTMPGFDNQPPHQHTTSPSNMSLSSPGLGVSGLALPDTPPSVSSRLSSKAAGSCVYTLFSDSTFVW